MARPKANQNEVKEKVSSETEKVVLVKMAKDDAQADVHPLEVENYKRGDWKVLK